MDPVSHGIVGAAIGSLSGGSLNLSNPYLVGSVIGAVIPDGDIILRLKGNYSYLKNHRGASHSLFGLAVISALLTCVLIKIYSGYNFISLMFWVFMGGLSHSLTDMLNSYGVQLFWPKTKKKFSLSLLMLVDLPLIICSILVIIYRHNIKGIYIIIACFIAYLIIRALMRFKAISLIRKNIQGKYSIIKVNILPSITGFFRWDFIVWTPDLNITGTVNIINSKVVIRDKLKKIEKDLEKKFMHSPAGKFFKEFTPIYHVECQELDRGYWVKYTDLRYYFKNNYMHHAIAYFDDCFNMLRWTFHPYSYRQKNVNYSLQVLTKQ
ncbi:MAG TPA: metal-dependent hydrolase [Clostridiales bacterium]|nr:metal-dependent hydrolase [Clostridiales bacterium]